MALTVSNDSVFGSNLEIKSGIARGMGFSFGRLTGTYGGALTTMTIPGMNSPIFVMIPPASNFAFQYNPGTTYFGILSLSTASASYEGFATYNVSTDLSSFTCFHNGVATVGVAFCAFGWGT